MQKKAKAAADVEYPAYGVTGVFRFLHSFFICHRISIAQFYIEFFFWFRPILGPNKDISPSSGDRRLAQSAQMYHYQHQKQQIIQQMGNQNTNDQNGSISDVETDEENEEGDYTVYECPGLASVSLSFGGAFLVIFFLLANLIIIINLILSTDW